MSEKSLLHGTHAAVITPRLPNQELDEARLRGWLDLLIRKGLHGFAINGATGEFCRTTEDEFERLMNIASEMTLGKAHFLACVGAAASENAIARAKIAAQHGASALLLPMPYFFPYSQSDLSAFCRSVAASVDSPILLYNLPQFTSPLEPRTSLNLIRECESIIGIKDSSGSLDTMSLLTREGVDACRLIGSDGVLSKALEEGVCDGVVSGVACVLPELVQQIYSCGVENARGPQFAKLAASLQSFLDRLDIFPTPWGLKIIAESRGLAAATFPFPLSHERQKQRSELEDWFLEHASELAVEQVGC